MSNTKAQLLTSRVLREIKISYASTYSASSAPFDVWKLLINIAVAVPLGYVSL